MKCGLVPHIAHNSQLMSFIAMRAKALITGFFALAWTVPVIAAPLPPIDDPIFHLIIPASIYQKGFQEVPQSTLKTCGMVVKNTASYRYWLLASTSASGTEYLMITGLVKEAPGVQWNDDTQGAFLELRGHNCAPIDPLDQVFPYYQSYATDTVKIEEPVFTALTKDAAHRYAHAFGSKANFLQALHRQNKYPALPILENALEPLKREQP